MNRIYRTILPLALGLSLVGCSQRKGDEAMRSSPLEMRVLDVKKAAVLEVVKASAEDPKIYPLIAAGYDSLVTDVSRYEDVAALNTGRPEHFETNVRTWLSWIPPGGRAVYVMDKKDPLQRSYDFMVLLDSTGAYFRSIQIPSMKK